MNTSTKEPSPCANDVCNHQDVVKFCITYGEDLISRFESKSPSEIVEGMTLVKNWLEGKCNYNPPRNKAIELNRLAKEEKDIVTVRYYRTLSQILASPHVKYHGLWATDFAITLINKLYPDSMEKVKNERRLQIKLISRCMLIR